MDVSQILPMFVKTFCCVGHSSKGQYTLYAQCAQEAGGLVLQQKGQPHFLSTTFPVERLQTHVLYGCCSQGINADTAKSFTPTSIL